MAIRLVLTGSFSVSIVLELLCNYGIPRSPTWDGTQERSENTKSQSLDHQRMPFLISLVTIPSFNVSYTQLTEFSSLVGGRESSIHYPQDQVPSLVCNRVSTDQAMQCLRSQISSLSVH